MMGKMANPTLIARGVPYTGALRLIYMAYKVKNRWCVSVRWSGSSNFISSLSENYVPPLIEDDQAVVSSDKQFNPRP